MKYINNIISDFGFIDARDFVRSLLNIKLLETMGNIGKILYAVILTIGTFVTNQMGITPDIFGILLCIFTIELITGLWASLVKKRNITSKRLHRFGLKVFVWMFFILILNKFSIFYKDNCIIYNAFQSFHTTCILYILGVYLYSIGENVDEISGGSGEFTRYIKIIKDKMLSHKFKTDIENAQDKINNKKSKKS